MKKYVVLFALVILFTNTFPQDTSKTIPREIKHGIQFQIQTLNIGNFDGMTFSYRYLLNNKSGFRVGIYTSLRSQNQDIIFQRDTVSINPPGKSDYYNFKGSFQYLTSVISYNDFDLIIGGGPFVSFYKSEQSSDYLGSSYIERYTDKSKTTGFGLDLILGVEFKLTENVIISGEYGAAIQWERFEVDNKAVTEYPTITHTSSQIGTGDETSISSSYVNFGIAVFF